MSGGCSGRRNCGRCRPFLLKTRAAKHWPSLGWLEGNSCLRVALGTDSARFCSDPAPSSGSTLYFALLAALGIVLKLLVVEEKLLSGREYKITSAIGALQYLIDELHKQP
jgi:hypothetical protein